MRFNLSLSTALVALLAQSVTGLGLRSDLARKLQLSAELGLDPNDFLEHHQSFHSVGAKTSNSGVSPNYVSLPIDHDDPSVGTYKNRYWVNDDYFEPGGPVILYDAGESNGEGFVSHLTSDLTFLSRLLDEFKAIGIIWEHRYYGESLPYPVSNQTLPEHFKYLTTAQALADIPTFAENFSRPAFEHIDLSPKSTPWVMVGGSYAGVRAALARQEYPDTIFAAFASSAPVQARIDMSSYNDQVYRGMVANGAGNCSKDIHAALEYIDDQLSHERTAASIKQLFLGAGAEKNSNEDFTVALGGIFGFYQASGMGGPAGSLGDFCNYLEQDPITNKTVGPEGLAPRRGKKYVAERWAKWSPFAQLVNLNMETNCRGLDNSTAPSCELNKPTTSPDAIAWTWQYCTEWGYYQSNNVGIHSILSRFQTLEFQQDICNRQFPEAVKSGLLPSEPQADALNEVFGGWTIRPSNVFFSEGEFDPWRTLSLLSTEEFSPRFNVTSEIPKCGVQTDADTVFGHVGANAFHCFDLDLFNDGAKESLGYFRQALKEWLPCFEKQKHD